MASLFLGQGSHGGLFRSFIGLLIILLGLAAAAAQAANEVGAIPGSFAVNGSGAATYSIPIAVPPGTGGLAPHLALSYNSQSSNGLAGWGWNLAGLSVITVCPKTLDQDGVVQGINFTGSSNSANDFCLDGSKLMVYSGGYGANNSSYRKEIDDFSKAIAYTSGGSGPAPTTGPQYFTVLSGNGLTYEYGKTADSEIVASGPNIGSGITVVRAWALDKVYDAYGNSVDFVYAQNTANGDFWPTSITWTNHNGAGGLHQIVFKYTTLTGGLVRKNYQAGSVVNQTKRLNEIDVNYNAVTTFTYTLAYDTTLTDSAGNPGTERSRLKTVTECAGTTCYPTTSITWQDGLSGWQASHAVGNYVDAAHAQAMHLMDVDGDGMADIVYPGTSDWMVMLANGSGFNAAKDSGAPVADYADALTIDFNGDGRMDLIEPTAASNGNWEVIEFQVNGTNVSPTILHTIGPNNNTLPATGAGGNAYVTDLDGDGLDDLIYSDSTNLNWLQNTGGKFAAATAIGNGVLADPQDDIKPRKQFGGATPDFNGDGAGDITTLSVWWASCTPDYCPSPYPPPTIQWTLHVDGTSFKSMGSVFIGEDDLIAPVFVDFNGDGQTDLLYETGTTVDSSSWTWSSLFSSGAGLVADTNSSNVTWDVNMATGTVVDYAGNGREQALGFLYSAGGNCPADFGYVGYVNGAFQSDVDTGIAAPICGGGSYVEDSLRAGDIDGDGLGDLVWAADGSWHYRLHQVNAQSNSNPTDAVTQITNNFNQTFNISYQSLPQSTSYTKGSSAVFPAQDFDGPLYVVTSFTGNDGVGGSYTDSYTYSGAKTEIQGRGFLGFAQVNVTETRSGAPTVETDATYKQNFPYIGAVASVTQKTGSSMVRASTSTYPSSLTYTTTNNNVVYAVPPSTATYDCELGHSTCDSTDYFHKTVTAAPALTWSSNSTNSLLASYSATVTTNPGNFVATTETNYAIDRTDWCNLLPSGVTVTRSSTANPTPASRSVSYTNTGSVCRRATESVTEPNSNQVLTTAYTYDPTYGDLQSVAVTGTDPVTGSSTRTTSYGYDSTNTFVASTTVSPDGSYSFGNSATWDPSLGLKLTTTDPNNAQTTWTYDAFGVVTSVSNPDGTSVSTTYSLCTNNCGTGNTNAAYQVVTTHYSANSAAGATATVVYDGFGRGLLQSSYLLNDQLDYVQTNYDSLGRVTAVSTPYTGSPSTWTYTVYDNLNRPTAIYVPAGQDTGCSSVYNGETTCATVYVYSGLTNTVTNAKGQQTVSNVDAIGETVSVTDAMNGVTSYEYDNFGDLAQTTDAANNVTNMEYDGWGRKTSMTDPSMGHWTYAYTPFGELASQVDAKSQILAMTYDGIGRLKSRTEPLNGGGTGTSFWCYDGQAYSAGACTGIPSAPYLGKLSGLQGSDGYARGYQYDNLGRPSETDVTIGATTYATSTAYDSFGRLASVTYPSAPAPIPDTAPIANAGANQTVNINSTVALNGSASNDPDSGPQPLTYRWTQVSGPASTAVDGSTSVSPSFTASVAGTYQFLLTVSDGELTNSATTYVTVTPLVPTGLSATTPNAGTGNFSLSWTAAAGDAAYQLEEQVGSGSYSLLPGTYTSPTTLSRGNGTYQYKVDGCVADVSVCSDWGTSVSVTELRTPGAPTQNNVTPNPTTNGNFTLSWSTPSGSITYYKLYSSADGSTYDNGTNVGNVTALSRSQAVNGTYYYKVAACNSSSCSAASNVKSVVVSWPVPTAPTMTANPSSINDGGSSTISWSKTGTITPTYWLFGAQNVGTTTSKVVTPAFTKTYSVYGCTSHGCGPGGSVTVTVNFTGGGQAPVQGGTNTTTSTPTAAPAPTTTAAPSGSTMGMIELSAPDDTRLAVQIFSSAVDGQDIALRSLGEARTERVSIPPAVPLTSLRKPEENLVAEASSRPLSDGYAAAPELVVLRQAALRRLATESQGKHLLAPPRIQDRKFALKQPGLMAASFASLRLDGEGDLKNGLEFGPTNLAPAVVLAPATVTYSRYKVDYVYDDHENLTEVVDDANPSLVYWQAVSANSFGQVTSEILGNGVITARVFDPSTGTLKTEQSGVSTATDVANRAYAWDAVGNLSSRVDGNHSLTDTFSYDNLNRLTAATVTGAQATVAPLNLAYDAVGNITSKSDMGTYAYDPTHPLGVSSITPVSGPARTFTYDNSSNQAGNGNLVNDGVRTYAWNAENKPIQVTVTSTGVTQTFAYTPDGQRYQEVTTQGASTTSLTEVNGLFQITNDGTTTNYKESILAGGGVVAIRTLRGLDGLLTTRYLTGDHLSSVTTVTNESGQLVCELGYDSFGNRRDLNTGQPQSGSGCSATDTPDKGYTSQQELDALNLIHMNGRVYDPQVGRMVSADPTVPDPFYSQSFNRYAYVYNNPLNSIDPSGFGCTSTDLSDCSNVNNIPPIQTCKTDCGETPVCPPSGCQLGTIEVQGTRQDANSQQQNQQPTTPPPDTGQTGSPAPQPAPQGGGSQSSSPYGKNIFGGNASCDCQIPGLSDMFTSLADTCLGCNIIIGTPDWGSLGSGKLDFSHQVFAVPSMGRPRGSGAAVRPTRAPGSVGNTTGPKIAGSTAIPYPGIRPVPMALPALGLLARTLSAIGTILSLSGDTPQKQYFRHYTNDANPAHFAKGLVPGSFATTATGPVMNAQQAQSSLSLNKVPTVYYQISINQDSVPVQGPSPVEPRFGQPGGGIEFTFPEGTYPGTVYGPFPLPSGGP